MIRALDLGVPTRRLPDLRDRIARAAWPAEHDDAWGVSTERVRALAGYWAERYDWDAAQERLDRFEHLLVGEPGAAVHVARPPAATGTPILLLHGWPGSFVQMLDLAELLAAAPDPLAPVVASLPGFAWSAPMPGGPTLTAAAERLHGTMAVLGHDRYAVHGTDFGAGVASWLAALHPESVVALHTGGTSPRAEGVTAADPEPIRRYGADVARWRASEVGYGQIQSTKPDTLAFALTDSPVGLLAWLVEKLDRWSAGALGDDRILDDVSVYWRTGCIGSSMRWYTDPTPDPDLRTSEVPIAWLMPRDDMLPTPREWVARASRIDRWTEVEAGGHFPEWTRPQLVADDIEAFLRGLRARLGAR